MKLKVIWILFGIWCLGFGNSAFAKPSKGFHEGPYFMLSGGVLQYTYDNNVRTGGTVGNDYEPTLGFNFGWNLKDYLAPELQVRYSTNETNNSREHIASINLNAVLTFITDYLTDIKSVKILPFVQAGFAAQFAAIPGDPLSTDGTIFSWGPGVSAGGGVRFLFLRYGYAGLLVQSDFLLLPDKSQDIGGTRTKVISGGWDVQPAFMGLAGFHF